MAYSREETENIEVDHPLKQLWEAIPKAIEQLEWVIQESDQDKHHLTIKTKGAFMSYPSTMKVDLVTVDDETTRMLIAAETPVTTITSVADFGRTRERIERFVISLAKLMPEKKN
jgi:hypothetical protein